MVFLDIQMPGLTGIELAARLCEGAKPPRVVFTTAYDHYTLQAFEHAAFDYLLKPIGLERLQRTVERLKLALPAPVPGADALQALLRQLGAGGAAPPPAPRPGVRAAQGQGTPHKWRPVGV